MVIDDQRDSGRHVKRFAHAQERAGDQHFFERLHEPGDLRLVVLSSVVLPPKLLLERFHGFLLRVRDEVEHIHEPDALEELVVSLLDEAEGREGA